MNNIDDIVKTANRLSDAYTEACETYVRATVAHTSGHEEQAIKLFNLARTEFVGLGMPSMASRALASTASCLLTLNRIDDAIGATEENALLVASIATDTDEGRVVHLHANVTMGAVMHKAGNNEAAEQHFHAVLTYCDALRRQKKSRSALTSADLAAYRSQATAGLATCCIMTGDREVEALRLANDAVDIGKHACSSIMPFLVNVQKNAKRANDRRTRRIKRQRQEDVKRAAADARHNAVQQARVDATTALAAGKVEHATRRAEDALTLLDNDVADVDVDARIRVLLLLSKCALMQARNDPERHFSLVLHMHAGAAKQHADEALEIAAVLCDVEAIHEAHNLIDEAVDLCPLLKTKK
jgi:hypothetical protein